MTAGFDMTHSVFRLLRTLKGGSIYSVSSDLAKDSSLTSSFYYVCSACSVIVTAWDGSL